MTGVTRQGPIAFIYAHWACRFQASSTFAFSDLQLNFATKLDQGRTALARTSFS